MIILSRPATAASGSGTCGRQAWRWSTSPTRKRSNGTRGICGSCARWVLMPSRPTLANGFRYRMPTMPKGRKIRHCLHDGSDPDKMHNYYTYLYNKAVYDCWKRSMVRRKPAFLPAVRRPAVSSSRCTGAATICRPILRWHNRCEAGCRLVSVALVIGATISAVFEGQSDYDIFKRWTSSGCFLPIAVIMAAMPIKCRGCTARKRSKSPVLLHA